MKELREILSIAQTLAAPLALATVVRVEGSSYRRPGARMLMTQDGIMAGMVSGGCLDADVLEHARAVIASGDSRLLTYDTRPGDDALFGIGTGCAGLIEIFVERIEPGHAALTLPAAWLDSRVPAILATVLAASNAARIGDRRIIKPVGAYPGPPEAGGRNLIPLLAEGGARGGPESTLALSRLGRVEVGITQAARTALASGVSETQTIIAGSETLRVFLEVLQPPLSLILCGAGPDAAPLVRLGKELGWQVTVVDHRAAFASPARFPQADTVISARPDELLDHLTLDDRTAVVIMTHHFQLDSALLAQFSPAPVAYLGLLGSRQRTERLMADLRERGQITPAQIQRLHAPIGLDLGATTPEEIALSIVAEIQSVTSRRPCTERPILDTAQAPSESHWEGPRTCAIAG